MKYSSNVRYSQLPTIARKYKIPPGYSLIASNRDDPAHFPSRGYITGYREQLRLGLRFPLYPLIWDTLMYWEVALAQLSQNFVRQIVDFILICKPFQDPKNLDIFSKFL